MIIFDTEEEWEEEEAYEEELTRSIASGFVMLDRIFSIAELAIVSAMSRVFISDGVFMPAFNRHFMNALRSTKNSLCDNLGRLTEQCIGNAFSLSEKRNNADIARLVDMAKPYASKMETDYYLGNDTKPSDYMNDRVVGGKTIEQRISGIASAYDIIPSVIGVAVGNGIDGDSLGNVISDFMRNPLPTITSIDSKRLVDGMSDEQRRLLNISPRSRARTMLKTETNGAYKYADWRKWQRLDFVVGIEIVTSENHGSHEGDICDELSGRYPKDFHFSGWHPNCRCRMRAVTKAPDELEKENEALLDGEVLSVESRNEVMALPRNFIDWYKINKGSLKSEPSFVSDNQWIIDRDI